MARADRGGPWEEEGSTQRHPWLVDTGPSGQHGDALACSQVCLGFSFSQWVSVFQLNP